MIDEAELQRLRDAVGIDLNALHHDAQRQPELLRDACDLAAVAKTQAKKSALALAELKATKELAIRAYPAQFGLEKVTEASIKAVVATNESVHDAEIGVIKAEEDAEFATSLVRAYAARKSMIQEEVTLWTQNYFGEVSTKEMANAKAETNTERGERLDARRKERAEDGN